MTRPSERFPTDPVMRVVRIADRSMPSIDRPRLSEELEKKLEPVERASAACYAEAEELTFQLRAAAEYLKRPPGASNGRR
jgi:hypothetical protein